MAKKGGAKAVPGTLPRIKRFDVALLLVLSAALILFVFANIELLAVSGDKRSNLETGLKIVQTGKYPGYAREPLYPAVIGIVDILSELLANEKIPLECAEYENAKTYYCMAYYTPYAAVNGVFLSISATAVFFIIFWSTSSRLLSYLGYLLVASSSVLLRHSMTFYTELPATAMIALAAALAVRVLYRPNVLLFGVLGLVLAALTLTKVVFAHLWWSFALTLLSGGMLRDKEERSVRLVGVIIMILAYLMPVAGWMSRNYLIGGDFALVEKGRSYRVYSVRASYNSMTEDEYRLGFLYYFPHISKHGLKIMGIDSLRYSRFDTSNPEGFRKAGQRRYKELAREIRKTVPSSKLALQKAVAEARSEMLKDPWKHLKVSILMAFRGAFPERGLGYDWPKKSDYRVGDLKGLEWMPRLGFRYPIEQATLLNLITGGALLLLPLVMFLRGFDLSGLLITLPALYSHSVYALVSHFIPRYAIPEIPLRVVATLILVGFLVIGFYNLAQRLFLWARQSTQAKISK